MTSIIKCILHSMRIEGGLRSRGSSALSRVDGFRPLHGDGRCGRNQPWRTFSGHCPGDRPRPGRPQKRHLQPVALLTVLAGITGQLQHLVGGRRPEHPASPREMNTRWSPVSSSASAARRQTRHRRGWQRRRAAPPPDGWALRCGACRVRAWNFFALVDGDRDRQKAGA